MANLLMPWRAEQVLSWSVPLIVCQPMLVWRGKRVAQRTPEAPAVLLKTFLLSCGPRGLCLASGVNKAVWRDTAACHAEHEG